MNEPRYRIVLKGELMEGYSPAEATRSLAVLFGIAPEKLRGIFGGRPVALKQELELKRAHQIEARLLAMGVKCSLAPAGQPAQAASSAPSAPPAPAAMRTPSRAATTLALQVSCPKCGHHQAEGTACERCGASFEKKEEEAEPVERPARNAVPLDLTQDQLLHIFIDSNSDKYLNRFRHFRTGSFALTWHWPALFVPFFWALYRKMWGWAVLIFVSMLVPFSFIIWPLTANYIYYRHAQSRLARLGEKPDEYRVAQAGGTSAKAVFAAFVVCMVAALFGASLLMRDALTRVTETAGRYAQAEQQTRVAAPDTPEAHKTVMMLRATALLVELWAGSGKDVNNVSLQRLAADLQQPEEQFRDGWGNPLRIVPTAGSFEISSAGPDGVFGSGDDIRFEAPRRR